jgi:hypothetical protein
MPKGSITQKNKKSLWFICFILSLTRFSMKYLLLGMILCLFSPAASDNHWRSFQHKLRSFLVDKIPILVLIHLDYIKKHLWIWRACIYWMWFAVCSAHLLHNVSFFFWILWIWRACKLIFTIITNVFDYEEPYKGELKTWQFQLMKLYETCR